MPSLLRPFLAGTALCLLAPAAFADLTAEDVWADWKAYITGFGYTVSGQETPTDDGILITGVRVGNTSGTGSVNVAMDRIRLTENTDGTVLITLPAIMPFETTASNDTGGTTRVSMDYRHDGLTITASGTPEALRYDYSARTVTLQSTGFEVNGQVLAPENNDVNLVLEGISGNTQMTLDSLRRYDQEIQADVLRYNMVSLDPTSASEVNLSGQAQALSFAGQSNLPRDPVDTANVDAMLAAGFSVTGDLIAGAQALTLDLATASETIAVAMITGDTTLGVEMGQDGLSYAVTQNKVQADIALSQFPPGVKFEAAKAAASLTTPLRQSDTPEDFGLGLTLDGFSMDDSLWALLDPMKQLPRDAASLVIDLSGKARLLFSLLDPTQLEVLSPDAAPVEFQKLDINQLKLSAVGADLSGKGAFTFDYGETGTPTAQGALDLVLVGGNALLDRLVDSGLLPEQQAMGARMMLGLLAVPGEAPDTMRSRIEINEQGHVLANGQRIQ